MGVLVGVIVTSYLTMNQDNSMRLQVPAQTSVYRVEAGLADAPVNQLLQFGTQLDPKKQMTPVAPQNREMGSVPAKDRNTFPTLR